MMEKAIEHISRDELFDILSIQSTALKATHDFMEKRKIIQLLPVMLSTITDPLSHPVFDSSIDYCNQKLELTKSMILHKQLALLQPRLNGLYIVSPNIRLELPEESKEERHAFEFSQVDIELKHASMKDFMNFTEELFISIFKKILKERKTELRRLDRTLSAPKKKFKIFDKDDLEKEFGEDFEKQISLQQKELFWITSHKREFYDKEIIEKPGKYANYDLVLPEGFGEVLSGGEREFEFERIISRMKKKGMKLENYEAYLSAAKHGFESSAGGGFGVERLTRFLAGKKRLKDVTIFARSPGEKVIV